MSMQNQSTFDPRLYLSLFITGLIAGVSVHTEFGMLAVFIIALIWQVIANRGNGMLGYILLYTILWAITKIFIAWLIIDSTASLAITMSNAGLYGRRAIAPILFIFLLAKQPTGSLMAALYAMRMPKAFGIGVATILRFFPTLKMEYRSIRNAQKFRGLGVGFWNTLAHLPSVFNYILIPLIIRITKISEELSASVTVRGVRFHSDIVSFRPVRFTRKDLLFLTISVIFFALVILMDRLIFKGVRL